MRQDLSELKIAQSLVALPPGNRKRRRLVALLRMRQRRKCRNPPSGILSRRNQQSGGMTDEAQQLDSILDQFCPSHPSISCPCSVPRLDDISAQVFFARFVAARQPAIIRAHPSEASGWHGHRWTNEYLRLKAGDCDVMVEQRPFGSGDPKKKMRFGELLAELDRGNTELYLTTQPIATATDGTPAALSAAPVCSLGGEFSSRPELLQSLIPHQYNIWMGNSPDGASSGLHHDFHDNLYILLRGKKRFILYPPTEAYNLYTQGKVSTIHPNGLISYDPSTRSDGVPAAAVQDQEAMLYGDESDEDKIESALEQMLLRGGCDEQEDDFDSHTLDQSSEQPLPPDNFCRVKPGTMGPEQLRRDFPRFSAARSVTCEVKEGEMLYLPASWFHEVISFSTPGRTDGHLAFNYWMHPPDAASYTTPYQHNFWEK